MVAEKSKIRLFSVQVMRAVAALAVVHYHLTQPSVHPQIGYVGVDVFFVISGVIMGTIGAKEGPLRFGIKRLLRVLPLYWVATLLFVALALTTHAGHQEVTALKVVKSMLFIPYYDNQGNVWPLLVPGWTLNYEMFFYVVFWLGLVAGRPRETIYVVMPALVLLGLLVSPTSAAGHVYTNPILLEFTAGVVLSQMVRLSGVRIGLAMVTVALVALAIDWYFVIGDERTMYRALIAGVPSVLLVGGVLAIERADAWPRIIVLEAIGDASYSLYLLHRFVLNLVKRTVHLPGPVIYVMVFAVSLTLALASFRWFEKPLASLRPWTWRRVPAAASPDYAFDAQAHELPGRQAQETS